MLGVAILGACSETQEQQLARKQAQEQAEKQAEEQTRKSAEKQKFLEEDEQIAIGDIRFGDSEEVVLSKAMRLFSEFSGNGKSGSVVIGGKSLRVEFDYDVGRLYRVWFRGNPTSLAPLEEALIHRYSSMAPFNEWMKGSAEFKMKTRWIHFGRKEITNAHIDTPAYLSYVSFSDRGVEGKIERQKRQAERQAEEAVRLRNLEEAKKLF